MGYIKYKPSKYASRVLVTGKILAPDESPQQMFERVVNTLFDIESVFNTPDSEILKEKERFAYYVAEKYFTPGTPTLTNAGRSKYSKSALSSCAIIPVDLRQKNKASEIIKAYFFQNMGSGFDLTPYNNPVDLLIWLNNLSAKETASGKYDRYIGNMANLHISHPKIREFIRVKRNKNLFHFNLSVDISEEFMEAAINRRKYTLSDKSKINAYQLLCDIAESSWYNGDPSIINLDRMNKDNPLVDLAPYTTTPPCAEMGMTRGETCQFAYINIAKFANPNGINYKKLADVTKCVTRVLDNAVEISINKYPDPLSSRVARLKRKIGIGVGGLADTLLYYDISYDSEEARLLARNTLSFINYISKCASIELAKKRGSCLAMKNKSKNKYYNDYLEKRYGKGTNVIIPKQWKELNDYIKQTGLLRNILTTTLPPAARVSILMNTSTGIEPIFGVLSPSGEIQQGIKKFIKKHAKNKDKQIIAQAIKEKTFQNTDLIKKECLKTAKEIAYKDHLKMVAALVGKNGVVDEAASKTVNLPNNATTDEVLDVFIYAHKLGLKNISVYRDGSRSNQPNKL